VNRVPSFYKGGLGWILNGHNTGINITGDGIMGGNIISIERAKKVLEDWQEIQRKTAEKREAVEKIKRALADNTAHWEVHSSRIAVLQKDNNTATPAEVEELRNSLKTLSDEGDTLNQMAQQVLTEIKTLEENAAAAGKEIIAICAATKKLSELFAEKK
jgi:predicted  nucleic acid-binding Zn-ribbon protein